MNNTIGMQRLLLFITLMFFVVSSVNTAFATNPECVHEQRQVIAEQTGSNTDEYDCHSMKHSEDNADHAPSIKTEHNCCDKDKHSKEYKTCCNGDCGQCGSDLSTSPFALFLNSNMIISASDKELRAPAQKLPNSPYERLTIPPIS